MKCVMQNVVWNLRCETFTTESLCLFVMIQLSLKLNWRWANLILINILSFESFRSECWVPFITTFQRICWMMNRHDVIWIVERLLTSNFKSHPFQSGACFGESQSILKWNRMGFVCILSRDHLKPTKNKLNSFFSHCVCKCELKFRMWMLSISQNLSF